MQKEIPILWYLTNAFIRKKTVSDEVCHSNKRRLRNRKSWSQKISILQGFQITLVEFSKAARTHQEQEIIFQIKLSYIFIIILVKTYQFLDDCYPLCYDCGCVWIYLNYLQYWDLWCSNKRLNLFLHTKTFIKRLDNIMTEDI